MKFKQLNPFELKSAIVKLLEKINSVNDIQNCLNDIETLDAQEDKTLITKLLFKELANAKIEKIPIICFLLEHFTQKDDLIKGLWEALQNKSIQGEAKITILNLLRELDADWSYESCEEYLDDAEELLDAGTKQLLNTAIINPETQIDFMDFIASIKTEDQITLIESLAQDFGDDELANILIPVFESKPNSAIGKEALKLLGQTKSELALHTLEHMQKYTTGELNQLIRKNLAILKMAGIREDNTKEFYKKILSNSKPDKFYITYPDGLGDMALICTRLTQDEKIRFISIVINIEAGIKDCFGFYEISQFECNKILERFLKDEKVASIPPSAFLTILHNSELNTIRKFGQNWELPYEYVCWKNLLVDIDYEEKPIEQIVKEQISPAKITESIFENLGNMKISSHWFLDAHYSDEFEELIKSIKTEQNLDKLVEKNLNKIFYEEEKISWQYKLVVCAYIKYVIGKEDEAGEIYGLALNEKLMDEFFKHILQRSIYEYLSLIKYNKSANEEEFSQDLIDQKIDYIEKMWVKTNV